MVIADSSPRRYRTSGVRNETFAELHSEEEYPGISRYSLKVCDGSLRKVAQRCSLSPAKGHRNDFFTNRILLLYIPHFRRFVKKKAEIWRAKRKKALHGHSDRPKGCKKSARQRLTNRALYAIINCKYRQSIKPAHAEERLAQLRVNKKIAVGRQRVFASAAFKGQSGNAALRQTPVGQSSVSGGPDAGSAKRYPVSFATFNAASYPPGKRLPTAAGSKSLPPACGKRQPDGRRQENGVRASARTSGSDSGSCPE